MASLATILDLETEIEGVFYTYITGTLGLASVKSDSSTILATPRVEITARISEMGPHQMLVASGTYAGRMIFDSFSINLGLDLVYSPDYAQSPGSLRGTLRKALFDVAGINAAFAVNGYLLMAANSLRIISSDRRIDNENKAETITHELSLIVLLSPAQIDAAT